MTVYNIMKNPQEIISSLYLEGYGKGMQMRSVLNPKRLLGWHKYLQPSAGGAGPIRYTGRTDYTFQCCAHYEFVNETEFANLAFNQLESVLRGRGVPNYCMAFMNSMNRSVDLKWNVIYLDLEQHEEVFDEDFFEPADDPEMDWCMDFMSQPSGYGILNRTVVSGSLSAIKLDSTTC